MANPDDDLYKHQFSRSNLKIDVPRKLVRIEENSLVFLRPTQVDYDIDVEKLSIEALRSSLTRITFLLNKLTVVERLPDQGYQLRFTQEKIRKEIAFREDHEVTHTKDNATLVKCASELDMANAHIVRLCSLDRAPQRDRYRPNVPNCKFSTEGTELTKKSRTGIQIIDLSESLTLQMQQDARIKMQQLHNKKEKLADEKDQEATTVGACEVDLEDLEGEEEVLVTEELNTEEKLEKAMKNFVCKLNNTENDDNEQVGPSGIQRLFAAMELSSSDSDIEPISDVPSFDLRDT